MLLQRQLDETSTKQHKKNPRNAYPAQGDLLLRIGGTAVCGVLVALGAVVLGPVLFVPLAVPILLGMTTGFVFSRDLRAFSRGEIAIGLVCSVLLASFFLDLCLHLDALWPLWEMLSQNEGLPMFRRPDGIVRLPRDLQEKLSCLEPLLAWGAAFYVSREQRTKPRCIHCGYYCVTQHADCDVSLAPRLVAALSFGDLTTLTGLLRCKAKIGFARLLVATCTCESEAAQIVVEEYQSSLLYKYLKKKHSCLHCHTWFAEAVLGCMFSRGPNEAKNRNIHRDLRVGSGG